MSMWEPRSSHLYVWTGLRVCEWLRVGAGHRVFVLVMDKWHWVCASVCAAICACAFRAHGSSLSTRACVGVRLRRVTCASCALLCSLSGHVSVWVELSRGQLCTATCGPPYGRVGTCKCPVTSLWLCTHRHV